MTRIRASLLADQNGFGLVEVMIAMVILAFSILGIMASYQWAEYGVRAAVQGTHALAMAQSRLESKRAARWNRLLLDDLDGDGMAELFMRDDGQPPDVSAADGLYTAAVERDGIKLMWTLRADPPGPITDAGMVAIDVRADYQVLPGRWKVIRLGALRGNPGYVGQP